MALRSWGVLVTGALATFLVLAVVYHVFPNPLVGGSLLDRGIWFVP